MTNQVSSTRRAGVIFDRDGVLNVDYGYVFEPDRLTWIAGAREAVAALCARDFVLAVATNQSGVGRGFFSATQMDLFHQTMNAELAVHGGRIEAFYSCPYHEDAVFEAFRVADHPDRKPNPGMLLRAIADLNLDPERTIMVGDKSTDMEAARRAGVRGLLFPGGDLLDFLTRAGVTK